MSMDYVPGNTFFHKLNPISKLLYCFVMSFPVMVSDDPIVLAFSMLTIVMLYVYIKIPRERLGELVKVTAPAAVLYMVVGIVVVGMKPGAMFLFYLIPWLNLVPVTLETLVFNIGVMLKFLVIVTSFRLVLLITPVTDIVRMFTKLRFPPFIAMAISGAFACMPVMYFETRTVQEAQKSRGLRTEYIDPVRKAKSFVPMLVPILTLSIQRSMNLAMAIESRGYGYRVKERTHLREIRFQARDYAFISILVVIGAAFVYFGGWWTNQLSYTFTVNLIKRLLRK